MEDWRTLYQQKLTTAEEAVKHIKSGDRVVVTHATGEPILLTDAMVANAEQYENVEVVHMVAMGKAEYCLPENSKHFRHNSLFLGGSTRKAIEEGRGDFTPVFFSEIPEFLTTCNRIDSKSWTIKHITTNKDIWYACLECNLIRNRSWSSEFNVFTF